MSGKRDRSRREGKALTCKQGRSRGSGAARHMLVGGEREREDPFRERRHKMWRKREREKRKKKEREIIKAAAGDARGSRSVCLSVGL